MSEVEAAVIGAVWAGEETVVATVPALRDVLTTGGAA